MRCVCVGLGVGYPVRVSTPLRIGDLFDERYRLDDVLGRGGFGTVFGATDLTNGRSVALKVLTPERDGTYAAQTRARFEREATIVGGLRSPHTVEIFEHGESDGLLYMAFERVPGEDLAALLARRGRLTAAEVRHVVEQVLQSLQEAHAHGVLHRDLKPENIRVFEQGGDPLRVKLLDFGIARASERGSPSVTATGELIGTPRYMSPEQLTDRPLQASSDIYSLGIVAFEMLVGSEAIHGGAWGDQLERMRTGHLFAVEGEGVDADLMVILQRMTARHATERFGSARAVLDALHGRTRGEARSPPKKIINAVAIVGVVALAGVALAIVATCGDHDEAPKTAPPARNVAALIATAAPKHTDAGGTSPEVARTLSIDSGCGSRPKFRGRGRLGVSMFETVLAYIPESYDPARPAPLVILLHQVVETPEVFLRTGGFEPVAEAAGFVVVVPESEDMMRAWTRESEDIDQVYEAAEGAARALCIDRSRVFAVGHGQGGRLARDLTCESWITGAAASSFRATKRDPFCGNPKPFIMLSPMHSPREPVEGGEGCGLAGSSGRLMSLQDSEQKWLQRNGCKGKRRRYFEERDSECFQWHCETPFRSCHLNGGHGWPGTPPREVFFHQECEGDPPAQFPSMRVIWELFETVEPLLPPEAGDAG